MLQKFGISNHREDFGQTLAKYKVPTGPFLMLPLLGASSVWLSWHHYRYYL